MTENPLIKKMQKIIPGTTVRLPSKGLFYKDKELSDDVVDGEIVLHPMTTLDEIIIRSPDMLFQGSAIEKVVSRCAPQVTKPSELFAKDIDYILIMLRKLSYGDEILLKFICPSVEGATDHEYVMNINHFIKHSKELDEEAMKRYKITLDSGMVLNLRPSKFNELVRMHQIDDETKTPEELEQIIMLSILAVIKDVDGHSDRNIIEEWLKSLSVRHMREVVSKIAESNNYGPDFTYKITCKDCKKEHDISYILNPVSFFTLPSSRETKPN